MGLSLRMAGRQAVCLFTLLLALFLSALCVMGGGACVGAGARWACVFVCVREREGGRGRESEICSCTVCVRVRVCVRE